MAADTHVPARDYDKVLRRGKRSFSRPPASEQKAKKQQELR
jgi:hypothetical protein